MSEQLTPENDAAQKPPEVQCMNPQCGAKFLAVERPNPPSVVNQMNFSMVVMIHEKPLICPNCGQHHIYSIAGRINYAVALLPVQSQKQPGIIDPTQQHGNSAGGKIIIPPAGARIKRNLN